MVARDCWIGLSKSISGASVVRVRQELLWWVLEHIFWVDGAGILTCPSEQERAWEGLRRGDVEPHVLTAATMCLLVSVHTGYTLDILQLKWAVDHRSSD
jgi:hypothetical protein